MTGITSAELDRAIEMARAASDPIAYAAAIDEASAVAWKCADRLTRHGNGSPEQRAALAKINGAQRALTIAALRLAASNGNRPRALRDARSMLRSAADSMEASR